MTSSWAKTTPPLPKKHKFCKIGNQNVKVFENYLCKNDCFGPNQQHKGVFHNKTLPSSKFEPKIWRNWIFRKFITRSIIFEKLKKYCIEREVGVGFPLYSRRRSRTYNGAIWRRNAIYSKKYTTSDIQSSMRSNYELSSIFISNHFD